MLLHISPYFIKLTILIRRHLKRMKAVAANPVEYNLKIIPNSLMGSLSVIDRSTYFLPNRTPRREQS